MRRVLAVLDFGNKKRVVSVAQTPRKEDGEFITNALTFAASRNELFPNICSNHISPTKREFLPLV